MNEVQGSGRKDAPLCVIVVDDHPFSRRQLVRAVESDGRLRVVAEGRDGDEALALASTVGADVILCDVRMPGRDGLDVARELLENGGPPVVLISAMESARLRHAASSAGASRVLAKSARDEEVIDALITAAQSRGNRRR